MNYYCYLKFSHPSEAKGFRGDANSRILSERHAHDPLLNPRPPSLLGLCHFVNHTALCTCLDCLILRRMCLYLSYIKAPCSSSICETVSLVYEGDAKGHMYLFIFSFYFSFLCHIRLNICSLLLLVPSSNINVTLPL